MIWWVVGTFVLPWPSTNTTQLTVKGRKMPYCRTRGFSSVRISAVQQAAIPAMTPPWSTMSKGRFMDGCQHFACLWKRPSRADSASILLNTSRSKTIFSVRVMNQM